jgi:hypothetical protein
LRGEAAAGVSSLRGRSHGETFVGFGLRGNGTGMAATAKRQRRSARGISAGNTSPQVREPSTERLPPFTREERLQRDFPRCEHYLFRAFEGLDPRRFGGCSGGFLVAGTERRRNRCKVWPAGKRHGEGEARPAAIAHGDFLGKQGPLRCGQCSSSASRLSFRCSLY